MDHFQSSRVNPLSDDLYQIAVSLGCDLIVSGLYFSPLVNLMGKDGESSATSSWLKNGANHSWNMAKSSLSSWIGNPASRMFHQTVDPTVEKFEKVVKWTFVAGVALVVFKVWRGRREALLRKQHIKAMQDLARKMEEISSRK